MGEHAVGNVIVQLLAALGEDFEPQVYVIDYRLVGGVHVFRLEDLFHSVLGVFGRLVRLEWSQKSEKYNNCYEIFQLFRSDRRSGKSRMDSKIQSIEADGIE